MRVQTKEWRDTENFRRMKFCFCSFGFLCISLHFFAFPLCVHLPLYLPLCCTTVYVHVHVHMFTHDSDDGMRREALEEGGEGKVDERKHIRCREI